MNVNEVEWIGAQKTTWSSTPAMSPHLVHVKMNVLEASLDLAMFQRMHRSIVVSIVRIKDALGPHREFVVVLRNGTRLQSSRTYHTKLKALTANPF